MPIRKKAAIYTLGCKANQYESEAISEALVADGYEIVEKGGDVAVINTCTVTAEADRKCRQTIRRAAKENPGAALFVTGCMAQVAPKAAASIPGVVFVCGNGNKMQLVDKIKAWASESFRPEKPAVLVESLDGAAFEPMCIRRSERTRAYIKVEDGCESKCAYCIIPQARGPIRSKKPEEVLREAKGLVAAGYKELVLTGIEVSAYGKDLENTDLGDLVQMLNAIPGIERIRFPSTDPASMKPAFIDKIAGCEHLAPHFHLSLQSGCDRTLNAMKRRYNVDMVKRYVAYTRERIPGVQFTADVIVGFPGESDEDFAATCAFLHELGLLSAHVFAYSRRPGTLADSLPDQIPEAIKHRRSEYLIEQCAAEKDRILREFAKSHTTVEALVETQESGKAIGRLGNYVEIELAADESEDLRGRILPVALLPCPDQRIDKLFGKIIEST